MQDIAQQLARLNSDGVTLSVAELVRYQQLARLIDLTPSRRPQARLAGSYLTKHKGRGMEFDEARHYQPGDDIRAIDWRVTARTGKTHTKIYREERERPVFLLCDFSASMHFGTQLLTKAVQAAHTASLISWSAAARGDKIGALLFGSIRHRECRPQARKRAVLGICHELIAMHSASAETTQHASHAYQAFADACARARRLARPGSLVYLISDFEHVNETARQHISQLARHCEVRAVLISDPMEHALPQASAAQQVSVTDGTEEQTWLLGDSTEQQRYTQWRQAQHAEIQQTLEQNGIRLHSISAGSALEDQIQTMRRPR
ncbi:DUF58 domain-containing protein [Alteromonas halophila]|uniref:DUF58 domain-containing protein n=1 Tax=Alteromonas halophila TaxID=516698 RepID=A0A918JCM9_9ALTE|nr:DUF58 domain-containing protein [Alteromonas halophila]GGW74521.1 hypothetical protein GCM10007391_03120 [Alteromonas halophila]